MCDFNWTFKFVPELPFREQPRKRTSDNVEQSSTKDQSPLLGVLYMEPDQTKKPM
jgi:hypothetical protein